MHPTVGYGDVFSPSKRQDGGTAPRSVVQGDLVLHDQLRPRSKLLYCILLCLQENDGPPQFGYRGRSPYGAWVKYEDKRNRGVFYYNPVGRALQGTANLLILVFRCSAHHSLVTVPLTTPCSL